MFLGTANRVFRVVEKEERLDERGLYRIQIMMRGCISEVTRSKKLRQYHEIVVTPPSTNNKSSRNDHDSISNLRKPFPNVARTKVRTASTKSQLRILECEACDPRSGGGVEVEIDPLVSTKAGLATTTGLEVFTLEVPMK